MGAPVPPIGRADNGGVDDFRKDLRMFKVDVDDNGEAKVSLPAKDMRTIERFIKLADTLSVEFCPVSGDAEEASNYASKLRNAIAPTEGSTDAKDSQS